MPNRNDRQGDGGTLFEERRAEISQNCRIT